MRWPRSNRDGHAIEVRDETAQWRSDFEEPLPPVTRNELLDRLGLDLDESAATMAAPMAAPMRMTEAKAAAAA